MGDHIYVTLNGEQVPLVRSTIEWGVGTAGKTFNALAAGGPMRRYGDIVRSRTGVTLMVIRRVSGFAMRRADQWECYALDADIDPGSRVGHWKDEELA